MDYLTIAFAVFGIAVGLLFRFRVLLPIILLVAVLSVAVSLSHGHGFTEAALSLMKWQVILQGSYFLGLTIKAIFSSDISHRIII